MTTKIKETKAQLATMLDIANYQNEQLKAQLDALKSASVKPQQVKSPVTTVKQNEYCLLFIRNGKEYRFTFKTKEDAWAKYLEVDNVSLCIIFTRAQFYAKDVWQKLMTSIIGKSGKISFILPPAGAPAYGVQFEVFK